mmetsp:Transcript_101260/g.139832  ORF Transcript_101260/g.139832 Transcript_101260/m.139832 type:complete len:218 (+) Transcript_101260:539-1192(+)|eukprot:CAMPEP_0176367170 /NCGR_PEP_ID=MMETSP0126-20121128/21689_1 /TAXON_ID=141414 ORGANISM="Strombidinopsis acuminatum, Strain SPMC142" /NCGR_SAMPLE_ID=MMETSP0126 /ASSEMBLY_ACC=CAM_ASM_000229 /LENGTH=217 /DNA_ID=CAMNT_0017724877 /DNA_START=539 /DNA_END=1192 /DNA_ORIENTATION=+
MLRWNQEGIDKEESCQEMNEQKNLNIRVATPSLMAVKNIPFPDAILAGATEPIVTADTKFVHYPQTKADCWNVSHANIQNNMIPPALSKVRKNVLPGELDDLVKQMPEVKNVWISDYKSSKEPVTQMHDKVVINIVPDVVQMEFTVIIIGMLRFVNTNLKASVKESENLTAKVWSHVKHENGKAHVDEGKLYPDTVNTLHSHTQRVISLNMRLQIGE